MMSKKFLKAVEANKDKAVTMNIEEENKMEKVIKLLNEKYKVNGENEKYATYYASYEDILADEALVTVNDVLESYGREDEIKDLNYPIIIFDDANATGGWLFESDEADEALEEAEEYFEKL